MRSGPDCLLPRLFQVTYCRRRKDALDRRRNRSLTLDCSVIGIIGRLRSSITSVQLLTMFRLKVSAHYWGAGMKAQDDTDVWVIGDV